MKKNTILIIMILLSLVMLGVLITLVVRPGIQERDASAATSDSTQSSTTEATETEPTESEPPYIPEVYPNVIGLYIPAADGTKDRVEVTEFTSKWEAKKDIDCFEAFASTDDRIAGASFAEMWKTVWDGHENSESGKIGYILSFSLSDGSSVWRVIRKPSDANDFSDYLEVYLYDDINQTPGVRYTHLSDSEIDENTILSSIKLTCGSRISEVMDIELSAFVYNGEDCFDTAGNYIGQVIASVSIKGEE